MSLPGTLVRSRVVESPGPLLATLLDRGFTGHVSLAPADTLLLDGPDGEAVLAFTNGVPESAYDAATDSQGRTALRNIAGNGPFRAELYGIEVPVASDRAPGAPVEAPAPARVLAGDEALARRTAAAAPDSETPEPDLDAVESFLADEEAIEALQERARTEATRRAEEWNLPD
ncbi:MAG: hypothetical protein ABEJ27_07185 [Halodesulfurarchaeum sp.]